MKSHSKGSPSVVVSPEKTPASKAEAPVDYPRARAFVVQFGVATANHDPFVGRAEHIVSGDSRSFACRQELVEFLEFVLRNPRPGRDQRPFER